MRTIGVLGGLGPQATMDFEQRVHRVAQSIIPPHFNGGYPPMVVHYCRHAPIIMLESGQPKLPLEPDPRLLESAKRLGALSDFIVITSNGVHLFQTQIEAASGRKVLSMVDLALNEVQRRGWKKIGVLGLGSPEVYLKPLAQRNINCETIDSIQRDALDRAIFSVMEGRDSEESSAAARDAVASLRSKNVDGIILGCTEIPLLLREEVAAPDLLDPLELLAEAAVRHAMA